ncbi:MAG: hypothetical protein PHW73_04130 [Atribacterota bacterium]|nr:hypothetical protein [Atribacterota bacterium]
MDNPYQEGTYYAIRFLEFHNDETKEWITMCNNKKEISGIIKDAEEMHKKGHWDGEELIYSVWKVTARELETEKVDEIRIKE